MTANLIDLQLLKQEEEHLIIFNVIMIVKFILKQTFYFCTKEGSCGLAFMSKLRKIFISKLGSAFIPYFEQ
jgi:hypothetical protein